MGDAVLDLLYLLSFAQVDLLFTLQIRSFELIHSTVVKCSNYNHGFIGDRLVSLYTRLGCIKDAHNLFDEIPHKDLVSWNSIISSFSQKGDVGLSLNAFYRLRQEDGMNPNEITLISLISACGTLEGGYIHGFAVKNGLISQTKVLNSLINMYGKFGYLNEASGLFETIKLPNLVSWNSIIKIHIQSGLSEKSILYFNLMRRAGIYPDQATIAFGDIELGEEVAERLIALNPLDSRNYIMLSSIYAKAGCWKDFSKVRALMKEKGLVRTAGCSYIEHGHMIHRFLVNDQAHPESESIYAKLDEVIKKIQKAGYVPNPEFVLHDVEEEVKESLVSKHSEKLHSVFWSVITASL
ncbi:pentatricopeptide repeat-containing protein At5g40410, mitochondrial-like [Cynara cardunculus var. scolymus]|uniref:pentatricopeptide repeat-containing protein At5g40410, mitochondrial-like n=1 Tax=Cynara cardunculus var. scolymus TaxID=59895 RepID=UPI000D626D45|nr:pentatricopeptide repeat-containing protein At5g40410, mitochondrial-like [Cynara cardunculus var. scolymus]